MASRVLEGKRALITGAGGGIGLATAREFAREGADVGLHFQSSRREAESAGEEIRSMGRDAWTFQGDLSHIAGCRKLASEAVQAMGGLDILVNNAGVLPGDTATPATWTDDVWSTMFAVNVTAPVRLTYALQEALNETRGVVINISSGAAYRGTGPYACSKAALNAATRFMSQELAPRVRVVGVAFGRIATERRRPGVLRLAEAMKAGDEEVQSQGPPAFGDPILVREGTEWEAARTIVFFASGQAGYFTGETVLMGGGNYFRS